jgi:hypothetical protein
MHSVSTVAMNFEDYNSKARTDTGLQADWCIFIGTLFLVRSAALPVVIPAPD